MAIELVCSCGQVLRLAQTPAGGSSRCPACGGLVPIAAGQTPAAGGTTAEPPASVARKPLWALMGKAAAPAGPQVSPPDEQAAGSGDSSYREPGGESVGPAVRPENSAVAS